MHIRNDPSLFFTNNTGAPHGDELGRIKPFSDNSYSFSDNSFNSDGAKRYGARATGAAPRIRLIWNSTCLGGKSPDLLELGITLNLSRIKGIKRQS
ncbi:hypothetical protein Tco_0250084 [Tanacetum coccineum]